MSDHDERAINVLRRDVEHWRAMYLAAFAAGVRVQQQLNARDETNAALRDELRERMRVPKDAEVIMGADTDSGETT